MPGSVSTVGLYLRAWRGTLLLVGTKQPRRRSGGSAARPVRHVAGIPRIGGAAKERLARRPPAPRAAGPTPPPVAPRPLAQRPAALLERELLASQPGPARTRRRGAAVLWLIAAALSAV